MKFIKAKIFIVITFLIAGYFFSNDFGLIDIEKTAIVTACAIDKEDNEYKVTLQIALPSEGMGAEQNGKALLEGKGLTVADAIGKTGTVTGWYPSLSFCNLILVGESLLSDDLTACLDYFSRSIKIQDSAILACTENNASDILKKTSPLDNISGFSLQKIILKKTGMDGNVLKTDLKEFENNRFSRSLDSYMPFVCAVDAKHSDNSKPSDSGSSKESSNSGQTGGENEQKSFFNASKTKLFKKGVCIGELNESETSVAVLIKNNVYDTNLPVKNVLINGITANYSLRIIKSKFTLKINTSDDNVTVKISGKLFVKIADETSIDNNTSHEPLITLPDEVKIAAEKALTQDIIALTDKCKQLKFDLFDIDLNLYRFHSKKYNTIIKTLWDNVKFDINVSVYGQKEYKK